LPSPQAAAATSAVRARTEAGRGRVYWAMRQLREAKVGSEAVSGRTASDRGWSPALGPVRRSGPAASRRASAPRGHTALSPTPALPPGAAARVGKGRAGAAR
jgi:hypothetical protein